MTFAYYGRQDAVEGLKTMDERGQKLTTKSLKKLEGVMYPEFYKNVAFAMQEPGTIVQSLNKQIDTILSQQWVIIHLDHAHHGEWVIRAKGVCP